MSSAGGVLHFTGLAWAGAAGRPRGTAAERLGFLSGACLVLERERFLELGGFAEDYFLYHEDVDLSLRILLAGGTLGVCTGAVVDHEYDFDKGPAKWRHLERNRWATIVRTYPAALLVLVLPALAVVELAVLAAAVRGGWWRQKLLAGGDCLRHLPGWVRERRHIQRTRTIGAGRFAESMVATLDSEYVGPLARTPLVSGLLRAYWRVVRAVLLVGAAAGDHGRDRPDDDRDVEPDRPVLDVREVEPHEVVEVQAGAAGDLPQAGHPRENGVPGAVPLLEQLVVAERERTRADEAHLPLQHVHDLRDLVQREPPQHATDARHARVVPDLEQRALGLVRVLERGLELLRVRRPSSGT